MMLAQLSAADPQHLKDWLIIALALASPILSVIGLVIGRRARIEPDPLRVQKVETLRDWCDSAHAAIGHRLDCHDAAINAIRAEIAHQRETAEAAARQRTSGIYQRIEDVRRELSDKIEAMPPQIIALLKNTNVIP